MWSLLKNILNILGTIISIIFIIAFSKVYLFLGKLQWFSLFFKEIHELIFNLFHFNDIRVRTSEFRSGTFVGAVLDPYRYSMSLLFGILVVSLLCGLLSTYIAVLLPEKMQKLIKRIMFFIESIPDVIVIFSIQLFVIWVYQKTDILVVDPIAGSDVVYILPIITTSILPSIILFQITYHAIKEEEGKLYIEFAKAKGVNKHHILIVHIFRNVCITVFSHSQYLFWFIMSNLLVTEYLFNINGIYSFMYKYLSSSEILASCLIMIFFPFYLFDALGNLLIYYLTGERKKIT
jgi:peptide/nickel transport system permease protein